jgi:hypothetical protein
VYYYLTHIAARKSDNDAAMDNNNGDWESGEASMAWKGKEEEEQRRKSNGTTWGSLRTR